MNSLQCAVIVPLNSILGDISIICLKKKKKKRKKEGNQANKKKKEEEIDKMWEAEEK